MSTNVLTVTEAVRHFSEYVSRVAYRHETFVLSKGNKAVAELRPLPSGRRLGDLPSILRSVPHLPNDDVISFGEDVDTARTTLASDKLRDPWAF
ncbi:MAG: type II toxin-antitoxin system Phd/YefM family antitoxin [Lentisphaerales bacterium]|nr:MAG: type II toxin-antitoxin system Phd/YefM family antitoxin [Lentisphaerales bacterium]